MAGYSMDIDPPLSTQSSNLKRSNSAPMINVLDSTPTSGDELMPPQLFGSQPRARRFSASFSPNSYSPQSPVCIQHAKMPSRVSQIKQEEGMDIVYREAAHERVVRSTIQMSISCEDLHLADTYLSGEGKKNVMEPLHIFPPPFPGNSTLSPTRGRKQCYSPSMQQPVRSPNPSPTRGRYVRRSLSPITLRPSQFPAKRKCEIECEKDISSPKKFHSGTITSDRNLLTPHPLTHSLSSSSLEDSASPEQTVPLGANAGTPESVSSSDSMSSVFKTVDQDTPMQDSAPPTPDGMSILQESNS